MGIANVEEEETENEIADALIDIIEDVVCSGPYNPTQQVKSRSLSRRKRYNKSKRRRPSNKSNVFPRERIHKTKTKTKSKSKVESLTSDSVLCSSDMFDHELKNRIPSTSSNTTAGTTMTQQYKDDKLQKVKTESKMQHDPFDNHALAVV